MIAENTHTGLGLFSLEIIHLISIGKKEKIIKDNYFLIDETISDLINTGNNIHMVEPLRDFNGYSWTTIPQEIESIDHNLIYQNLRILVGHKFLNKWIRSNEFMIDYFEEFKEELENRYGVEDRKKIIDLLAEISVLLEVKYNPQKIEEYTKLKEELREELEKLENKEKYIEKVTNQKINLTEKIKKIDTIINNKELLEKEYKERNEKLPLEQKIFSIRILSQKMQEERDECFKEIDKLNEILNPQNFVKHKKEIENKYRYLKTFRKGSIQVIKLHIDEKGKDYNVAKLVIETFNRKLKAEEVAYHKNGIISDNRLSNLQITTRSEAGKRTGWQSHRKSIVMLDNEGVIIKVFKGTRDAAKNLFISRQTVSDYCNKRVENPMYDLYWGDELIDKEGE